MGRNNQWNMLLFFPRALKKHIWAKPYWKASIVFLFYDCCSFPIVCQTLSYHTVLIAQMHQRATPNLYNADKQFSAALFLVCRQLDLRNSNFSPRAESKIQPAKGKKSCFIPTGLWAATSWAAVHCWNLILNIVTHFFFMFLSWYQECHQ